MSEIIFDRETIFEDWATNGGSWFRLIKNSEEWISIRVDAHGFWYVKFCTFDDRFDHILTIYYELHNLETDIELVKNQVDAFLLKISKMKAFI